MNPKYLKVHMAAETCIFKHVTLQAGVLLITDQAIAADLHATAFKEKECSNF